MSSLVHHFHIVPALPLGAAVLCVDEDGVSHTYLRADAPLSEVATDLAWIRTVQAEDYCLRADPVAV